MSPQPLKAVILAAGLGSRLLPLTEHTPKSLLKIGSKTILEMMISNILDSGIQDFVIVTGYLEEQIKNEIKHKFPALKVQFVTNDKYAQTNMGYSLMLVKDYVQGCTFIRFDADVAFDKEILKRLIACGHGNYLSVDKGIALDFEEIKVTVDENYKVQKANKQVDPKVAIGESIGIEKVDADTNKLLFEELELMMQDEKNHQSYHEVAYERIIEKRGSIFEVLDITGLEWVEIDTEVDYELAKKKFLLV